jgi:hypothetical protein
MRLTKQQRISVINSAVYVDDDRLAKCPIGVPLDNFTALWWIVAKLIFLQGAITRLECSLKDISDFVVLSLTAS